MTSPEVIPTTEHAECAEIFYVSSALSAYSDELSPPYEGGGLKRKAGREFVICGEFKATCKKRKTAEGG